MKIQNIHNEYSKIYYTVREGNKLTVKEDNTFTPYFFEPDINGMYNGYYGEKLTKICCKSPYDIKKNKTSRSYSADILYPKRYIIDRIDTFTKSETKYLFYDIEVKASDEFPDPALAKYPITFITCWDNYSEEYVTFDYREYSNEYEMLIAFCNYIQELRVDMILAWNILDFDHPYIVNRFPDFNKKVSPIGLERWTGKSVNSPALISIVDLMGFDHKFTGGKRDSYALDNVLQEEFEDESTIGEVDWKDEDFVKHKNRIDVERMVKLAKKNNYINLFDSIRLFSKCLWEDLPSEKRGHQWQSNNTKPWDMLFFQIAKENNIILPSKPNYTEQELEKFDTDLNYKRDGAYRDTFKKGIFI